MEMGLRAQADRPEINGSGDFDAKPIRWCGDWRNGVRRG